MKRKALKTLTNKVTEFIPESYKDFKEDAEDIYERPLIFGGKRMTREQRYEFQDIIKVSYPKGIDITKMDRSELAKVAKTSGNGEAYKYVWDNCIYYLKNVIININGEDKKYDKVEAGEIKDLLWESAQDFDIDIIQAISHFITDSSFTEEESKN